MITPTINVNLKPPCEYPRCLPRSGAHADDCGGPPALIPCPLPCTMEMTVRLGACDCPMSGAARGWKVPEGFIHGARCPARPICVTCSISGETWEKTDVMRGLDVPGPQSAESLERAYQICRERWAQVKAAVLGKPLSAIPGIPPGSAALIARRDAVFAALCKMAKAEEALYSAYNETLRAIDGSSMIVPEPHNRSSAIALERYVTHLIKQIGAMS